MRWRSYLSPQWALEMCRQDSLILTPFFPSFFESVVRNCWHVSAPSPTGHSLRRVRVTRRDGSQAVIEVPEDLIAGSERIAGR